MHASLLPKTNAFLLIVWIVSGSAAAFAARPFPWKLLLLGSILGIGLGLLQLRALRASRTVLLATQTAMDVRRALAGTTYGRAYLYSLWGAAFLIVVAAFVIPNSGGYFGAVAGYCALASARELSTIREAVELQSLTSVSQT